MLMALFGGAAEARTSDVPEADMAHAGSRVQILGGRIAGGLQFYRISGLTRGLSFTSTPRTSPVTLTPWLQS